MILKLLKKILSFGKIPEWRVDITEHCMVFTGFKIYTNNSEITKTIDDRKAFLIVRVKSGFGYGNIFKAKVIKNYPQKLSIAGVSVKLVFYDKKDMLRYKLIT